MMFIYDKDLMPVGPASHALRIGYEERLNNLTTAQLTLPTGDEMVDRIIVPASFARIHDGEEDLGYFRFYKVPRDEHAHRGEILYDLQSAQCTLLDDSLDGWHEIGGTGIGTRQVIEYILARQSKTGMQRWVLGECDFQDYYQYNFQDVTLLEALMSLGEVLLEPFRFIFDSTAIPWTMHLKRETETISCQLTYNRNMTGIRRSIDGRVVTRLRGRGYGEGDNQLTIRSVNGGLDYIDADAAAMDKWGVRCGTHVDTRQTDPALLKAHMEQILMAGKQPTVSYEADAIDLWRLTGEDWDHISVGPKVLVLDETLGEVVTARVTGRRKSDILGDPGGVKYTLDNSVADTAEELNEIRDKIGVHELYSQGATNMYSMQISDNADEEHPLTMRFYVPGNVLRINSCLMTWEIEAFRTYITMAKSGGGGARTSQVSGGATVTIPAQTYSTGVKYTGDPADVEGSGVGYTGGPKNYTGAVNTSTGSAGNHSHNFTHVHAVSGHDHDFTGERMDYGIGHNHSLAGSGAQATGAISSGVSRITATPRGTIEDSGTLWTTSAYDSAGGSGKQATGENGSHSHSFDHVHSMPHVHSMAHEHTIPAMSFKLEAHSHTVELPEHEHEVEYGVYEGARAEGVTLCVDGNDVPADAIGDSDEIDIAPYLSKDSSGKVTRGTFHRVEFVPSGLTRLTANLFFQVFIQSRGAGDY